MKHIATGFRDTYSDEVFALTHEDALAAYVSIKAVHSQLIDEGRTYFAITLSQIMNVLHSYLFPEDQT